MGFLVHYQVSARGTACRFSNEVLYFPRLGDLPRTASHEFLRDFAVSAPEFRSQRPVSWSGRSLEAEPQKYRHSRASCHWLATEALCLGRILFESLTAAGFASANRVYRFAYTPRARADYQSVGRWRFLTRILELASDRYWNNFPLLKSSPVCMHRLRASKRSFTLKVLEHSELMKTLCPCYGECSAVTSSCGSV